MYSTHRHTHTHTHTHARTHTHTHRRRLATRTYNNAYAAKDKLALEGALTQSARNPHNTSGIPVSVGLFRHILGLF